MERAPVSESTEAVHRDPVWRQRSDFIIRVAIDPTDTAIETEQLWARMVDARQFEVCCIPFFFYGLALGDLVETDDQYQVLKILKASGRFVFRVWFTKPISSRSDFAKQLVERGALVEWSSTNLLGVDAENRSVAIEITRFLEERKALGEILFESGSLA